MFILSASSLCPWYILYPDARAWNQCPLNTGPQHGTKHFFPLCLCPSLPTLTPPQMLPRSLSKLCPHFHHACSPSFLSMLAFSDPNSKKPKLSFFSLSLLLATAKTYNFPTLLLFSQTLVKLSSSFLLSLLSYSFPNETKNPKGNPTFPGN